MLDRSQLEELARITDPDTGYAHFLEHHVTIQDQRRGAIRFEMWPAHQQLCRELRSSKLLVVLKGRQVGVSWNLGAAYPLWTAMFHPLKRVLLFSQRENEAAELVSKIRFVWARLPEWLKVPLEKDNAMELVFGGGLESEILAFSGSPYAGSGYSAALVVSDEWAKQTYAEQQYASIRPTVDMGGQFIGVSTAAGPGTFHAQVWHEAKKGVNGFTPVFIGYDAHPERDAAWWEHTKATYAKEWQFFQEYPRDPTEAIQSSSPRVFPTHLELLAPQLARTKEELRALESPDWALLSSVNPRIGEVGLKVYQLPQGGKQYAIGADVAEGDVAGDCDAALVVDRDSGEEVAVLHGHWDIPTYGRYLTALAEVYNGALLAPERNNHGAALILALNQERIARTRTGRAPRYTLYHDKPLLDRQGRISRPGKPGFLTTRFTKPTLISDLLEGLVEGKCRLASQAILEELLVFRQNEDQSYSAPSGYHDDLVMSLAIAWHLCLLPRSRSRPLVPYAMGQHPNQIALATSPPLPASAAPLDRLVARMEAGQKRRQSLSRRPTRRRR